jgi:aminoglycoside phosphotransferase (APT) family kinase protein
VYERLVGRPVPDETLRWVARQLGHGASVVAVRRLRGGSSTAIHAVDVEDRRGARHALVLRRFIRPNWKYPGLARREANVLEMLERARYPAPQLVAFDDGPRVCDVRSLLMTRLPGRVDLAPKRIGPWLRQMAEALPSVHAIPLPMPRSYRPYYDPRARNVPAWSKQPKAWAAVIDLARSPQPRTAPRFIHRDYHPGNILWSRGKLSGVVDWISACGGPPQIDIAHCRVNLVRLHGVEIAARFLAAYASASGTSVEDYDAYWDAIGLVDSGLSRHVTAPTLAPPGLTDAKMRSRLDEFAVAIAARS